MKRVGQFVRHAKRFGTEMVYETAEYGSSAQERVSLARHLRRIDPEWKIGPEARDRLIADMVSEGEPDHKIGEALGISRRAAFTARTELANPTPANALSKPEKSAVFEGCGEIPRRPENFTPHGSGDWQSWVYGGAKIRHVGAGR